MTTRAGAVGLLTALLILGAAGPAAAHNVLISSSPPAGAQLSTGPERVELVFDLPVQQSFSTLTVTGPGGTVWEAGPPRVSGQTVSVDVLPLGPAGRYVAAYRILSADGHPVSGQVSFTLTRPGGGLPGPARSGPASPGGAGGGTPAWPWVLGAGVLLVAGIAAAWRVSRPR